MKVTQTMPKQVRITLLALKIHQRKAIHMLLQEQYKERLTLENNYYMELSTLFRVTGQKIINEYKKSKEAGLNQQNIETQIQVLLDGLNKDYKELQEKYQEKTRKTAIRQIQQIKEKQKKKQLGQQRPGHEKTANKFINTLLQTKIKPKIEKLKKKTLYKIKPNKKVKKEIRKSKQDLSKTILSKPTKKPKNATNTLLQTKIENRTEQVTQRINKEIKEILKLSETQGIGTKEVAEKLQEKFSKLKGYEAERIARTEINAANNKVAFNEIFNDETVDYKQWITCGDNRVRESHIELDEQITRVGDKFSNGLQYPGDHNGKAKEVINCRCTLIPYFLDWNKIPPLDKTYFYEKDLVELDEDPQKQVELQYDEDIKLAEVKQGYVELNKELDIKVNPIQKILEKIKKPIVEIENTTHNAISNIQVFNKADQTTHNTTSNGIKQELKVLVDEEAEEYKKLMQKLKETNGKIFIDENNKVQLKGGNLKLLEKSKIKKLYKKENGIKKSVNINKSGTTKINIQKELDIQKELQEKANKHTDKLNELNEEINKYYQHSYDIGPYAEKIKKLEPKVKSLKKENSHSEKYLKAKKELEKLKENTKKWKQEQRIRIEKEKDEELQKRIKIEDKLYTQYRKTGTTPEKLASRYNTQLKGENFKTFDKIEQNEEEYHRYSVYYKAQQGKGTQTTEHYTNGSGKFNQYTAHKLKGDQNALDKYWKDFKDEISKPDSTSKYAKIYKDHPNNWKTKIIKQFEKEYKDLQKELTPLNEKTLLFSGQNLKFYKNYKEGDIIKLETFMSTSTSKDISTKFLKKYVDEEDGPCLFEIYNKETAEYVPMLERAYHEYNKEGEFVKLPGSKFEVKEITRENIEIGGDTYRIPVFRVKCEK